MTDIFCRRGSPSVARFFPSGYPSRYPSLSYQPPSASSPTPPNVVSKFASVIRGTMVVSWHSFLCGGGGGYRGGDFIDRGRGGGPSSDEWPNFRRSNRSTRPGPFSSADGKSTEGPAARRDASGSNRLGGRLVWMVESLCACVVVEVFSRRWKLERNI